MTVLRSLCSYLQTYGYTGTNPAHGDFVAAPSVRRDAKTVGLALVDCRSVLEALAITVTEELPDGTKRQIILPASVCNQTMLSLFGVYRLPRRETN